MKTNAQYSYDAWTDGTAMSIDLDRQGTCLVLAPDGRLDGFGSHELEDTLKQSIKDDIDAVVLDLTRVQYLSSAGIRVFVWLKRFMKERDGALALAGVNEFPRSVLEMGGFLKIIPLYETRGDAIAGLMHRQKGMSLLDNLHSPATETGRARYTLLHQSATTSVLQVSGSLDLLLHSRLSRPDIRDQSFSSVDYSLGLGAIGGNLDDAYMYLGEMIALHGSVVYVPTDGHRTPDFFTPLQDTGKVRIFTGFSISCTGPFQNVFYVEAQDDEGVSLKDLYQDYFSFAKQKGEQFRGVIGMVMYAISAGVRSSEITRSPVVENAPSNGKSIMDPENYREWTDVMTEARYRGDTLVSYGIGIDLSADLSSFNKETLQKLYYIHPANVSGTTMYLHNHGVVFSGFPWSAPSDLNERIKKIVHEGAFVDMRHLLDESRIRKAYCGIFSVSGIREQVI